MIKQLVSDLHSRALHYLQNNDYFNAEKLISHCLIIDPKNSELLRIKGICKYMEGDIKNAKIHFKQAVKNNLKNYLAYSNLANINLFEKDFSLALENYKIAIKINPQYAEGYNNLGNFYQQVGEYENAIYYYNLALKIESKIQHCNK